MDKKIRRNEFCVINQPGCDFAFSSTRNAFIGYGFFESALEIDILKDLLVARGIEPTEAGGTIAPAQNAFCTKICAKIITSQFCVILLNNDVKEGKEIPNANVNMEYGLMLGFNKYTIPFQREEQVLPFNVAGLDTVKYTNQNFKTKAEQAIDAAIATTTQDAAPPINPDQIIESFLLSQHVLMVPLIAEGDKNLFELGRPLGFNMLMTFDGMQYLYFGNFTLLRSEAVLWRLRTLEEIIEARFGSLKQRAALGFTITTQHLSAIKIFAEKLQLWVLVTSDDEKATLTKTIEKTKFQWPIKVFALSDIAETLKAIM